MVSSYIGMVATNAGKTNIQHNMLKEKGFKFVLFHSAVRPSKKLY